MSTALVHIKKEKVLKKTYSITDLSETDFNNIIIALVVMMDSLHKDQQYYELKHLHHTLVGQEKVKLKIRPHA